MKNIEFYKLTLVDLPILKIIGRQTFYDAFISQNSVENMADYLDKSFNDEKLEAELNEPNSSFYFAKYNDEIIGYLKINFAMAQTDLKDKEALEIERIYVLKDFQGQKIGTRLLNFTIKIAKRTNLKYIWLGVWDENKRAISFYQKHGFKVFSSHSFKMGDDIQTDFLMKRLVEY